MRIKLTGIVEVQVEVETEVADLEHFYSWVGGTIADSDLGGMYLKYLRDRPDDETEVWMVAPPVEGGVIMTAEFVEAEVLDG